MINSQTIWTDIVRIRERSPLIHNITNYVVMNTTANALLSMGASPVMAHAEQEVNDMVKYASALVINIGTLSEKWIKAMQNAIICAEKLGIPIVLDPVGAGATSFRTETIKNFLSAASPAIIRGNASEIMAIVDSEIKTKGVDSLVDSKNAIDSAKYLSHNHNCAVCISGEKDYIVAENHLVKISNGHSMMAKVTGLGCTASALCGAFAAINTSGFAAASHAMAVMGIAGEIAVKISSGPGSLQMNLLDVLYSLTEKEIVDNLRLEKVV